MQRDILSKEDFDRMRVRCNLQRRVEREFDFVCKDVRVHMIFLKGKAVYPA